MNKLITWFRENIYPRESEPTAPLPRPAVRVRPPAERPGAKSALPKAAPTASAKRAEPDGVSELVGRVEEAGPGKNVFVPSKYTNLDSDTQDSLEIVGEQELEIAEEDEGGIDPYNTGHFKLKDNWKKSFDK